MKRHIEEESETEEPVGLGKVMYVHTSVELMYVYTPVELGGVAAGDP